MATEEELNAEIAALGEQIRASKQAKKPKEEWDPILQEMLSAKAKFKELTGKDHVAPHHKPKKKAKQQASSSQNGERQADDEAVSTANRQQQHAGHTSQRAAAQLAGEGQQNFGDAPMVQSQTQTDKIWTAVEKLEPALAGQEVLVRGHLQRHRAVGKKLVFVLVRSSLYSVQGVAIQNKTIPRAMLKYIAGLPAESVVDMKGKVTIPEQPVESATQKMVELQITSFHCVCRVRQALPFQLADACRPESGAETETHVGNNEDNEEEEEQVEGSENDLLVRVGQNKRLDNRWLDLRTPANQAIFRIESMVGVLFRECLVKKGFVEIHTPKLIGGASEGGAKVFTLDYFGQPACLAMSPQLHKQMAAACSGFERVFETGPVFRAENANGRRHLCEFTGFDMEMVIHEHYDEVLDVFSDLFIYIFDGINERCKAELERVREQHPFEDLQYLRPTLKLTYAEGCALLRSSGIEQNDDEDLSTENEKKLGDIIKEKYGTDFFFMDKYPLAVRPFYTMPNPDNPRLSNSYDFFIRGQEILSGAQRIHEPDLIEERARAKGMDVKNIEAYVNSFRHGALPHGGGGIGLERVVMQFLGLPNIRKTALFPRDPKRIAP